MRLLLSGMLAVFVVGAFGAGIYALRLPAVTISSIHVSDGAYVDTAAVEATAAGLLKGSYAWIIPRSFALAYPRASIITAIRASFPAVKDVSVDLNGMTALAITLNERTPVARWCMDGQCYFLDDGGRVFAHADSVSGLAYSGLIKGDPVGQTFLGGLPAQAGGFPVLADFMTKVPGATRRTPLSVTVDPTGDVTVVFAEGGSLVFNRAQDLASLLNSITTTFGSAQFTSGKAFDYADFRFGNKVYVKWK